LLYVPPPVRAIYSYNYGLQFKVFVTKKDLYFFSKNILIIYNETRHSKESSTKVIKYQKLLAKTLRNKNKNIILEKESFQSLNNLYNLKNSLHLSLQILIFSKIQKTQYFIQIRSLLLLKKTVGAIHCY
jgi:hypothetical protein